MDNTEEPIKHYKLLIAEEQMRFLIVGDCIHTPDGYTHIQVPMVFKFKNDSFNKELGKHEVEVFNRVGDLPEGRVKEFFIEIQKEKNE